MFKNFLFLITLVLFLSGCQGNPFNTFYQDMTNNADLKKSPFLILPAEGYEPKIIQAYDEEKVMESMLEDGYVLLGYSNFEGPDQRKSNMVKQGKAVSADTVVYIINKAGQRSGYIPIQNQQTHQLQGTTRGYIQSNNTYNSANYNSNTNATVTTTSTQLMPYTVNIYQYSAGFFIKAKTPILGINFVDLTTEERKQLGQNTGIKAKVIIKRSPAFIANIQKNDFILKFNGEPVIDSEDMYKKIGTNAEKEVNLEILRDGNTIPVSLKLNKHS